MYDINCDPGSVAGQCAGPVSAQHISAEAWIGGAQKMWYSCSKRATTGCKATACVVATSEEREDGSLLWTHQFEKVSSYEVTLSMILIIQALLLSLLFRTIASSMCLSLPRECRISSKISLGTERRGIPL